MSLGAVVAFAAIGGTGLAGSLAKPAKAQYGPGQYQYGAKVTICHKEKVTLRVSINAWPAHQKQHGDQMGSCAAVTAKLKAAKLKATKLKAAKLKAAKLKEAKAAKKAAKAAGKSAKAKKAKKSTTSGTVETTTQDAVSVSRGNGNGKGNGNGGGNGKGKGH